MHWPGAGIMIYASIGFLLVGFVPLYVVNVFQKSGKEKPTLPYIVMLLVGIACVMLFSNINMSKDLLDIYMEEALTNEQRVEEVQERTGHQQASREGDQLSRVPDRPRFEAADHQCAGEHAKARDGGKEERRAG